MALSSASLSTRLQNGISGISGITISSPSELAAFCTAVATAIVAEIQANATISASGVDPQGGSVSVTGSVS